MPQRCGLALRASVRLGDGSPVTVTDVTEHINKRRNALYSEQDIDTAFKKLVSLGLAKVVGRRVYQPRRGAMLAWKVLDKTRR